MTKRRSPRRKKKRRHQNPPHDEDNLHLHHAALEQLRVLTRPLLESVTEGPLEGALRWSGTVMPEVLMSLEFWLLCGLHAFLRILHWKGVLSGYEGFAGWEDVKVFTIITVGFLAMHVDNCCLHHTEVRSATVGLFGSIYDLVFRLRLYFRPWDSAEHPRLALRWITASLMASLQTAVSGREPGKAEWRKLVELGLLRKSEVIFFSTLTTQQRPLVLLHATGDLLRVGLLQAKAPDNACADVSANLLQHLSLQSEVSAIADEEDLRTYRQELGTLVVVLLLMWAYIMAVTEDIAASVVYPFLVLLLLGVLQLSTCLAHPFSAGSASLRVADWTVEFSECLEALLSCNLAANAEEHRNLSHMNSELAEKLLGSELPADDASDEADSVEPLLLKDVVARKLEEGYANSSVAVKQLNCGRKKVHKHRHHHHHHSHDDRNLERGPNYQAIPLGS